MNWLILQHQRVLLGIERLEQLLDEIDTVAIATIVDARWRFARQSLAHLDSEDALVFPVLLRDPGQQAAATARMIVAERDALADAFELHARRYWTDRAIDADRRGYAASLRPNLHVLRTLLERKHRLLYPLLGDAPAPPTERIKVQGRWMAQAWKYRATAPAPR